MSQFTELHAEAALSRGPDYSENPAFPSLDRETRAAVDTACAAFHLNRQPQTLRIWASKECGALRPFRVHGRLMWSTSALRKLCGVAE